VSHLLICGAAGYTNIGDDAILWGMLSQLQAGFPTRSCRVAGGPKLESLVRPFGASPLNYDDPVELARSVEEADLVILGGGGLLYDIGYDPDLSRFLADVSDRQWLYQMAKVAAGAAAAGRPAMLWGVGAGPLTSEAGRRMAAYICKQVDAVTLRDRSSIDLLAECGVPRSRLHLTADPALLVDPSGEPLPIPDVPRPWVAVNLRPWGNHAERDRLIDTATVAVQSVREHFGGTALLIPFQRLHDDDRPLLRTVADRVGNAATVLDEALTPTQMVSLLSSCDCLLGMRLHALILAFNAGIPFVSVAYDEKVSEFARSVDLQAHTHAMDDLEADKLVESCQALLEADLGATLEAKRNDLRAAASIPVELAKDILEFGRARPASSAVAPAPTAATDIRVLMRIRPDHLHRPGGDTVQMTETKRSLEALGVRVDISAEPGADLSDYDLIHAFNLGRPEDPYRHCLEAVEQGSPIALSTVYWDFSEFWQWGDPDYWELPAPGEGIPHPRPAPPPGPIEVRRRARLDQLRRLTIDLADVFLPNGRGEGDLLHDTYDMDLSRTVVVTNAVDEIFFDPKPDAFIEKYGIRDFVLCAARVEKRKNQLALITALRGTGIPLVIIGQPNPDSYLELCRRYADADVTFIDAVSHAELAAAYASARVHALPGWFETPGLSTLEAAAGGCTIVSTDRGTTREYLGDDAWYCDPSDLESIRNAVILAYEGQPSDRLRDRVREQCTWPKAAQSTLEGYRIALWLRERRHPKNYATLEALRGQIDYLTKVASDRGYEAEQMRAWAETVDGELKRLQGEFKHLTSRRFHRWSAAVARAGWSILRAFGVKQ